MVNIDNLILESILKFDMVDSDKELILNRFSHQLLCCVVDDINLYKNLIYLNIAKYDNIYINERLVFQYFDCLFRASTSWDGSKCIDELTKVLSELDAFKDNPSYLMFKGALYMLKGDRASAFQFYERSATRSKDFFGLPRMYLGANSIIVGLDWLHSEKRLPAIFPKIQKFKTDCSVENSNVIFLAADSRYFNNFNNFILNNLKDLKSKIMLHFHVVDWDKTCESFRFEIAVDFKIGLSCEDYRYFRDKTYFATVRFYRALEIMNVYNSNLYIGDTDNKFMVNTESFFDSVKEFDVGLRFNKNGNWFPWWGPSAGSFYAANTEYGHIFLKHLNEYVAQRFKVNQSKTTWWFDQLALNEVYFYCKENYPEMKFVNLSEVKYLMSVVRPDSELGDSKRV